jgi:hypothetical protein
MRGIRRRDYFHRQIGSALYVLIQGDVVATIRSKKGNIRRPHSGGIRAQLKARVGEQFAKPFVRDVLAKPGNDPRHDPAVSGHCWWHRGQFSFVQFVPLPVSAGQTLELGQGQ